MRSGSVAAEGTRSSTTTTTLIWGVTAALIMWLGARVFVALISTDPVIGDTAIAYLYVVPLSIGFLGMMNIANASFNALGKPAPPLLLSLLRMLVVYVPMAILGARLFGYLGVFVATALVNVGFGLAGRAWNTRTLGALRPADGGARDVTAS